METTQHQDISVSRYLSVAVSVAEASGLIIREVYESGNLGEQSKGIDNPVTLADLRVQKTIEENFAHFFPSLVTKGEESAESMEGIVSSVLPENVNSDFIKMEQLTKEYERRKTFNETMRKVYGNQISESFESFNTEKAVVWIDPLDGTSDFVKGNLSAVTVLIGLAIDGVPKIGVVHNPFITNENDGKGMTIFGS